MSNVTTTIVLEGQDRASAAINKAKSAVDGTSDSLKNAADQSGKFERGFKGIKDILGGAGGPFGEIADKLGGVESILMGMPAALGPIALGAAAIGAGVAYWYAEQEKVRLAALKTAQDAAEASFADKAALAERLGVSKELLGVAGSLVDHAALAAKKTTELAENEKKRLAAASEGNKQLAEDLRYRGVVLTAELQTLDRQRAAQDARLNAEKSINEQQRLRRELQAGQYDETERKAASLMDKVERGKALDLAYQAQQRQLEQDRLAIRRRIANNDNAEEELAARKELNDLGAKEFALDQKRLSLAQQFERQKGKSGGSRATPIGPTEAELQAEDDRVIAAAWATSNKVAMVSTKAKKAARDEELAASKLASDKALRLDMENKQAMIDAERELQDELQRTIAYVGDAASAIGGPLGNAAGIAAKAVAGLAKEWKGMSAASPDIISAVGQMTAAMVDGEREKSAILAITEAAASAASFATGNIAGGIGHGAAALLYGAAAAGVGQSAPEAPAGGAAGIQPASSGSDGGQGGGGGGGGNVTHINFNRGFVIGTPQQVGQAIQGAVGSLKNTGMSGAGV